MSNRSKAACRTYTVPDTAAVLGISDAHAYDLVKEKKIPAVKLGQRYVVPAEWLERVLEVKE
jgi:excisionase family DNA binding protein